MILNLFVALVIGSLCWTAHSETLEPKESWLKTLLNKIYNPVSGNANLRSEIDLESSFVSVSSSSTFSTAGPHWVWRANNGDLYVTKRKQHLILKVVGSTVSTFAGTGTAAFGGDSGAATSASFNRPTGIWSDNNGNLLVADTYNFRIRRISLTAPYNVDTIAGTGEQGVAVNNELALNTKLFSPFAGWTDTSGNTYFTELHRCVILWFGTDNKIHTLAGTGTCGSGADGANGPSVQLNKPYALFGDGSGKLFFTEFLGHRVRTVDISSTAVATIAGTGTSGVDGDGGLATSAQLNRPSGVWVDQDGTVLISDGANNRIRAVSAGKITTVVTDIKRPRGIIGDNAGTLFIAEATTGKIISTGYDVDALVAYYPFNGNTLDESGNGHHITINGAAPAPDRFGVAGKAFYFDGASSFMTVPDGSAFDFSAEFTISLWIKPVQASYSPYTDILSKSHGLGGGTQWAIEVSDAGSTVNTVTTGSTLGAWVRGGGGALIANQWNHYVTIKNGATLKTYINGALIETLTVAPDLNPNGNAPLMIGAYSPTQRFFKGFLDDIFIFNKAITAQQAVGLGGSSPVVGPDGLVASFQFNGDTQDASGNGLHATNYGATLTTDRYGAANKAYSFDGTSSYMRVIDGTFFDFAADFTIAFWIKPALASNPPYTDVLSKSHGNSAGSQWAIEVADGGATFNTVTTGSTLGAWVRGGGGPLPVNQWSHYLTVKDGSTLKTYINGVLVETLAVAPDLKSNGNAPLNIGAFIGPQISGVARFFKGALDEIIIYNKALPEADALALYNP